MSATQARDEWASAPQVRNVRSMRLRNDTWDQAEGVATKLHRSRAEIIESLTEAALGFIRCYRCREAVPVRFGNLKGKPLAAVVVEAELAIARRHPSHDLFWVGEPPAGTPRSLPASRPPREPQNTARDEEIIAAARAGKSHLLLAAEYGLTRQRIQQIVTGPDPDAEAPAPHVTPAPPGAVPFMEPEVKR